eukprot:CAMPEP_0197829054 /NCGR_PEP_ID=MMETSP1437-20131217/5528_1 /TAXON_ID=49252 ORGANISM="Eucampia antarctica, Strain CCMP1452" /NCGR_SAMPLE_ID=MMETSP1437 /ASSEMBLY_ACC=CAM_ASM_001096 /LENGTH=2516 /DNA_ID=CAMNT_0043430531 /DNA_START=271 /DNA_END=7821 /DNA_ORIENTATION=+
MSSLTAQLAAIHSNTNNNTSLVGQSLAPSKRHEDAIGRGIRHSTQVGYSLAVQQGKFLKPSILHDSATVEDIPLTTLRENCVSSLQQLQAIDSFYASSSVMSTLCGPHSLRYERGLNTNASNTQTDQLLRQLLLNIATVLGDDDKWKIPALHVLEYILRRYDVHIHLASHLLLCTLPQHESPLFSRILQLVDLTSISSHWLFLRPYAAPGVNPIPRSIIAKWTGNDNHEEFMVQLCQFAQQVASVHHQQGNNNVRRGISLILSFVAAVLVEAIITSSNRSQSIKDSTVRALLPHILDAVQGKHIECADWRSFGYVLISTLLDNCTLNNDVKEVLATSILKGVIPTSTAIALSSSDKINNGHELNNASIQTLENVANAIVAVLSILIKIENHDDKNLLLGYNMPMSTYRAMVKLHHLLPSTLGFLFDERNLDVKPVLSSLLSISIPRLLTSDIPVKSNTRRDSISSDSKRGKAAMEVILSLLAEPSLRSIWSDKDDHSLSASTAATLVTAYCSASENDVDKIKNNDRHQHFQTLLDTLRSLNPVGCDSGIAHAIKSVTSSDNKNNTVDSKNNFQMIGRRLSQLLGKDTNHNNAHALTTELNNHDHDKQSVLTLMNGNKNHNEDDMLVELDYVLPPRVALEHPNSNIRLRAIDTLLKEATSTTMKKKKNRQNTSYHASENYDDEVADDLAQALIQRFASDDNPDVAAAAANGVRQLHLKEENTLSDVFFLKRSITDDLIAGLKKWSIISKHPESRDKHKTKAEKSKTRKSIGGKKHKTKANKNKSLIPEISESTIEAMNASLQLCSLALQTMSREMMGFKDDISSGGESASSNSFDRFDLLMIGLISHLGCEKMIGQVDLQASAKNIIEKSILEAMSITPKESDSNEDDTLCALTKNPSCIRIIIKCVNKDSNAVHKSRIANTMRQMFLINVLRSYDKNLLQKNCDLNIKIASSLVLLILRLYPDKVETKELSSCLNKCVTQSIKKKNSEQVVQTMIDIVRVDPKSKPSPSQPTLLQSMMSEIDSQCKIAGSSVVLLLEAACQQSVESPSVCLLLDTVGFYVSGLESVHDNVNLLKYSLIMTLALLGHFDFSVRDRSLKVLKTISNIKHHPHGESLAIHEICNLTNSSQEISSILRGDGINSLPKFFRQAVLCSRDPSVTRRLLLKGCAGDKTAMQHISNISCNLFGTGTSYTSSMLLIAMESAGEDAFPLQDRWEYSGQTILKSALEDNVSLELAEPTTLLIETAVVMLKGIKIDNDDVARASNIIISIGPGRRSYSIGAASDGVSTINPYPEAMQFFIITCLSTALKNKETSAAHTLSDTLCTLVLGSTTWSQIIFPRIKIDQRKKMISHLLSLRSVHGLESAGTAFQCIPLDASDFIFLLESEDSVASSSAGTSLLAVSFVAECIYARSGALSSDKRIMDLSSTLFEWLSLLSKRRGFTSIDSVEGSDYTCASIMHALLAIHQNIKIITVTDEKTVSPHRKGSRLSKSKRKSIASSSSAEKIAEQAHLIVTLLGGQEDSHGNKIKTSLSKTAKTSALALLTHLCSLAPTAVVSSLLPAVMNVISSSCALGQMKSNTKRELLTNTVGDALMAIVPAYCTHAQKAGMSIAELLGSFIMKCDIGDDISWNSRLDLYRYLVDALLVVPSEENAGKAIASVICLTMADEAFHFSGNSSSKSPTIFESESEENPIEFAFQLNLRTTATNQISAAIEILGLVSEVMSMLTLDDDRISFDSSSKSDDFKVCANDVVLMALKGPSSTKRTEQTLTLNERYRKSLRWLIVTCLSVIDKILNCHPVRKLVRDDNNPLANLCLRMWQDLMQMQTVCAEARDTHAATISSKGNKIKFLDGCSKAAGGCLTTLQQILPAPHFLACISSLMNDDEISTMMQTKSISLLSHRASHTNPNSAEAALFLEAVPDLVSLVVKNSRMSGKNHDSNDSDARCDTVVQQSALIAIEQIARSLGLLSSNMQIKKRSAMIFGRALKVITDLLNHSASSLIRSGLLKEESNSESHHSFNIQVLSTAALCASTLVHLLKAKCLPQLPNLAKPLIASLSTINTMLESNTSAESNPGVYQSFKLLQLAILRTMVSVSETLPQFLVPYLDTILSPNALPSSMLRQDHNSDAVSVKMMCERFDTALSTRAPCRQLVPALAKAITKCFCKNDEQETHRWKEALSILSILKASINNASQSDLGPIIGKVVKSVIQVYDFLDNEAARSELIDSANAVLISLVMKLSEAQLRPIYAKLREWRGEIDNNSDKSAFLRRYAFWSLSAALSKNLRSIFLPCMSSVVPDIVSELEHAVSCLCINSKVSLPENNKRRKLESTSGTIVDEDSLVSLQPLLLCLELALKADAHDGGNWTRGGEGQRYTTILKHLGKLLQAKIPTDLVFASDDNGAGTSVFDIFVSGIGAEQYGSVSSCLTALAAAAGNEQMWKPLNHAVLEACGNESRPEVRKAGVRCLLSIIQSLGEEYMVLLPECLPILSELLEDEDEETAGLARECVRQGEELLGESLDDSLR